MKKLLIIPIILIIAVATVLVFKNQTKEAESSLYSGLVGYWTLDEDDTSGTTIKGRKGPDGTMYGGGIGGAPTSTAGKKNQAIDFDGTNGYVSTPEALGDSLSAGATLSAWIKPATSTSAQTWQAIIDGYNSQTGTASGFQFKYDTHSGELGIRLFDGGGQYRGRSASSQYKADAWQHVVAIWDGSFATTGFKIYVDGVQVDDGDLSGGTVNSYDSDDILIGAQVNQTGLAQWFYGTIDEAKIWNRVLSDEEVREDYRLGRTTHVNASILVSGTGGEGKTLVGYWTMDQNDIDGTTVYDKSGQANHGTATGFTSTPTSTTGKIKETLDFDGSNGYVGMGDVLDDVFAGADKPFSISTWIKPGSVTTSSMIITKTGDTNCSPGENQRQFYTRIQTDSKPQFTYFCNLATSCWRGVLGSTPITNLNKWYHLVFTYDGSIDTNDGLDRVKIYVDGVADSTSLNLDNGSLGNIQDGAAYLGIGERVCSDGVAYGTILFDGKIDEVKIWNFVLSLEEVANEYKSAKRKYSYGVPLEGLVGYWNMDQNDINGTTVFDKSGQGNHGTAYGTSGGGAPTSTTGKINQTLDFDGSNGYVSVDDSDIFTFGDGVSDDSPFSISAWIKMNDATNFMILSKGIYNGDNREYYFIVSSDDKIYMTLLDADETTTYLQSYYNTVLTDYENKWIHVATTYEGSGDVNDIAVYINGVQVNDATNTDGTYDAMGNKGRDLWIGRYNNDFVNGQIDEVMIWNRALS
ncbi:LamG domain-containing protein, partial [Patescibacteria group bacterium]